MKFPLLLFLLPPQPLKFRLLSFRLLLLPRLKHLLLPLQRQQLRWLFPRLPLRLLKLRLLSRLLLSLPLLKFPQPQVLLPPLLRLKLQRHQLR